MKKIDLINQLEELLRNLKESSAENVKIVADTYYQGKMQCCNFSPSIYEQDSDENIADGHIVIDLGFSLDDPEDWEESDAIIEGDVFKHYKNTCYFYCIQDFAKIQKDNIWIDAVIYTRLYDSPNIKFVRSKEEFIQKFNKVQIQESEDSDDKFIS